MSRTLSTAARQAVAAEETDAVFLLLLTISHSSLPTPIRVVRDGQDCTSRGEAYTAYPFDLTLPDDQPETVTEVQLTIDNVDRSIVDALRVIAGAPTVTLEVVLASSPDTVEAGPFDMTLRDATYTATAVTGRLIHEDLLREPYPGDAFVPSLYPSLF